MICPINHLLNCAAVQRLAQILSLRNQRNLVFVLLLVLPVEEKSVGVESPFPVSGQIEPPTRQSAAVRMLEHFAECHGTIAGNGHDGSQPP